MLTLLVGSDVFATVPSLLFLPPNLGTLSLGTLSPGTTVRSDLAVPTHPC